MTSDGRGILYPARLPTFHREPAPGPLREVVRWFWVPRWQIAPGRTSRQQVLPFPASNLVVELGGVTLVGPQTGASHRDLTGTGWAVGMLLRPAGLGALEVDPTSIRDGEVPFEAVELHDGVVRAMAHPDETAGREEAIAVAAAWAAIHLAGYDDGETHDAPPGPGARTDAALANAMEDLVANDPSVVRVEQVAERLHLSMRTVQRLARRYVGVPPLAIIRRYRLQEAVHRLRADPDLPVSQVAADLGYADHAHLDADFRRVLGLTPSGYRRDPGHRADG